MARIGRKQPSADTGAGGDTEEGQSVTSLPFRLARNDTEASTASASPAFTPATVQTPASTVHGSPGLNAQSEAGDSDWNAGDFEDIWKMDDMDMQDTTEEGESSTKRDKGKTKFAGVEDASDEDTGTPREVPPTTSGNAFLHQGDTLSTAGGTSTSETANHNVPVGFAYALRDMDPAVLAYLSSQGIQLPSSAPEQTGDQGSSNAAPVGPHWTTSMHVGDHGVRIWHWNVTNEGRPTSHSYVNDNGKDRAVTNQEMTDFFITQQTRAEDEMQRRFDAKQRQWDAHRRQIEADQRRAEAEQRRYERQIEAERRSAEANARAANARLRTARTTQSQPRNTNASFAASSRPQHTGHSFGKVTVYGNRASVSQGNRISVPEGTDPTEVARLHAMMPTHSFGGIDVFPDENDTESDGPYIEQGDQVNFHSSKPTLWGW